MGSLYKEMTATGKTEVSGFSNDHGNQILKVGECGNGNTDDYRITCNKL